MHYTHSLDHQYFNCEEGKGSLVPLGKLQRGRSFLEALRERYIHSVEKHLESESISSSNDSFSEDLFWVDSRTQLTKQVELVGMDKIAKQQENFSELFNVSLLHASVAFVDSGIAQILPSLFLLFDLFNFYLKTL